jgi:hypothetical protein
MTAPALASRAAEVAMLRAALDEARRERDEARAALLPEPLAIQFRRAIGEAAYRGGVTDGWQQGWMAAEADMAASWRAAVEPIAHPEREADRRLQAAIAGERRDQAEHERAFVARAYNTDERDRTDAQRAAVLVYPPPSNLRRSA